MSPQTLLSLLAVLAILVGAAGWILAVSRWWERIPGLSRAAGRLQVRELLSEPAPAHLLDARGGYRGGWKGIVVTRIRFEPPLDRDGLLAGWLRDDGPGGLLAQMDFARDLDDPAVWFRPATPAGGGDLWLLVDEEAGRAVLYKADARAFGG